MQLASVTSRPVVQPPATADVNLHVLRTSELDDAGVYSVDTHQITLAPGNQEGGFVLRSVHYPGYVRSSVRHVQGSDAERAAAQAVRDAIHASGLLALAQPRDHIGRPGPGLTRVYFDRRSSFVEFRSESPPPAAQAVLDAVAAWARLR